MVANDQRRMGDWANMSGRQIEELPRLDCMSRTDSDANVRDQVDARDDRQTALRPAGEIPLVVPNIGRTGMHLIKDRAPVRPLDRIIAPALDQPDLFCKRPLRHVPIEMTPSPPPRRPAPGVRIFREIIGVLAGWELTSEIVPADVHDALVAPVMRKQAGAVREKRGMRDAIILEHYHILVLFESPTDGGMDPDAAAEIHVREIGLYLTGPVHPRNAFPCFLTARLLGGKARTVGSHQDCLGLERGQCANHPPGQLRTIKDDEQNGRHRGARVRL